MSESGINYTPQSELGCPNLSQIPCSTLRASVKEQNDRQGARISKDKEHRVSASARSRIGDRGILQVRQGKL